MIPQYAPLITDAEIRSVAEYMSSGGWLTEHKITREFEDRLCQELGVEYAACVNNGTIAISIALLACGIRAGDAVLVPGLTMVATATACQLIGARPIFVDVDQTSLCMDPEQVREQIELAVVRPKALIYVSLNGRWDRTGKVLKLFAYCRSEGIAVIEDAAQSLGSVTPYGKVGQLADITTFSFSPHKIITTGQGGAIVTRNAQLAKRVRQLKDFGRLEGGSDVHQTFGINSKFTDVQAAIGLPQLKRLKDKRIAKLSLYFEYYDRLNQIPEIKFVPTDLRVTVPWFVDIYSDLRDDLCEYLHINGVQTRKMYPAMTEQPCFKDLTANQTLPVSEYFSRRGLWLPSSFALRLEHVEHICSLITGFFNDFRQAT